MVGSTGSEMINEELNYDIQNLTSIYRQISIEDNDNFDISWEIEFVENIIDKIFPQEFKHIDSIKLLNDVNLFNNSFIKLIKNCQNENFKKTNIIFIAYCDYFDLNYNKAFLNLHQKVQTSIKKYYIKMIGKKEYVLLKLKHTEKSDVVQPTLFDFI